MYRSQDAAGHDIAVTGVLYAPISPSSGPRPIVAWAHGTTGLAARCAPSKAAIRGTGTERLLAGAVLSMGYAFVYTDYEGLGTPGVHTYVVGESEGRTVLDSILAAARFPGAGTTSASPSVVWGHSQGGGAALWAAQLAPTYAPDAHVTGVVAGAPAAELVTLGNDLRTSPFFGYQLMAVAGFHAAFPALPLAAILTPAGRAEVARVAGQCADQTLTELRGQDPNRYFTPAALTNPAWRAAFDRESPGGTATSVPIFIYQGTNDEQIPVATSATVAAKYCRLGVTVVRKVYPGATHTTVIPAALGDISAYIGARLAGQPAPRSC